MTDSRDARTHAPGRQGKARLHPSVRAWRACVPWCGAEQGGAERVCVCASAGRVDLRRERETHSERSRQTTFDTIGYCYLQLLPLLVVRTPRARLQVFCSSACRSSGRSHLFLLQLEVIRGLASLQQTALEATLEYFVHSLLPLASAIRLSSTHTERENVQLFVQPPASLSYHLVFLSLLSPTQAWRSQALLRASHSVAEAAGVALPAPPRPMRATGTTTRTSRGVAPPLLPLVAQVSSIATLQLALLLV